LRSLTITRHTGHYSADRLKERSGLVNSKAIVSPSPARAFFGKLRGNTSRIEIQLVKVDPIRFHCLMEVLPAICLVSRSPIKISLVMDRMVSLVKEGFFSIERVHVQKSGYFFSRHQTSIILSIPSFNFGRRSQEARPSEAGRKSFIPEISLPVGSFDLEPK
jgi:hypothetical protein